MLPRSTRVSLGIDRRYKQIQASATYAYIRGARRHARREPERAGRRRAARCRATATSSRWCPTAAAGSIKLQTNLTVNQGALFPLNKSAPRFSFKRVTLFLNYTLARNRNNSDGAFAVPAFGDIASRLGARQQRRAASPERDAQQPDREEPPGGHLRSIRRARRRTPCAPGSTTTAT